LLAVLGFDVDALSRLTEAIRSQTNYLVFATLTCILAMVTPSLPMLFHLKVTEKRAAMSGWDGECMGPLKTCSSSQQLKARKMWTFFGDRFGCVSSKVNVKLAQWRNSGFWGRRATDEDIAAFDYFMVVGIDN
jgi:hypothetical protein